MQQKSSTKQYNKASEAKNNIRSQRHLIFEKNREGKHEINEERGPLNVNTSVENAYNQKIREQLDRAIIGFSQEQYTIDMFKGLAQSLKCRDIFQKHRGIIGITKLHNSKLVSGFDIIEEGLLHTLIQQVKQTQYPSLQEYSLLLIQHISCLDLLQSLIEAGIVSLLIKLIESSSSLSLSANKNVIRILGNLASDVHSRDMLLQEKALDKMIEMSDCFENKQEYCWAISNLCRGTPLPQYQIIKKGIMELCRGVVSYTFEDMFFLADSFWAISRHCQRQSGLTDIMKFDLIPVMMQLMRPETIINILVPCIRICGNASTTHSASGQIIRNNGFDVLFNLLEHQNKVVRRQSCWIISNLVVQNQSTVIDFLSKQRLVQKLLAMLSQQTYDVRNQITYIFSNIFRIPSIEEVYDFSRTSLLIKQYITCLSPTQNPTLIKSALKGLSPMLNYGNTFRETGKDIIVKIFERWGGRDKLIELERHADDQICGGSRNILSQIQFEDNKEFKQN